VGQLVHPFISQVAQVEAQLWQALPLINVPALQLVQAKGEGVQVVQLVSRFRQETALLVGA